MEGRLVRRGGPPCSVRGPTSAERSIELLVSEETLLAEALLGQGLVTTVRSSRSTYASGNQCRNLSPAELGGAVFA